MSSTQTRKAIPLRTFLTVVAVCAVSCLLGAPGCVTPPGITVDGYASAKVETWHDADGDGEKDPNETSLSWVTIQMAYERSITDSSGQGTVGVFKPGCAGRCWQDESVSVRVPPGYRATTPTELNLTGPEDAYAFGFQPENGVQSRTFPGEPDWAQAFLNRGLGLVGFGYDVGDQQLALTLEASGGPDQNAVYGDVFDIIRSLQEVAGISIEQVEIISLPSGSVAVCDLSQVEAWLGKLPPEEVVSTYCRSSQHSTPLPPATPTNEPGATHASESPHPAGPLEGRWCFESETAAFELQLEQVGEQVSGSFFLLKYCEVEGVRSACRIREGDIAGVVNGDQAEITLSNPEYDDQGSALLILGQNSLSWEVVDIPQEYYLPVRFDLVPCGKGN
jgi:hypothetical protein